VAAVARQPSRRRAEVKWRKGPWAKWAWRQVKRSAGAFVFRTVSLLGIVGCLRSSGKFSQSMQRSVSAFTDVAEAGSKLAVAGANASVASLMVDAVSTGVTASDDFWQGVDLAQLQLHRASCRMVGRSPAHVSHYLASGAAGVVPAFLRPQMVSLLDNSTSRLQYSEVARQAFDSQGTYWSWVVRARERSDSVIAASVAILNASFLAEWSNPL